uniref:Uncharacterized protein n=1 Tax=Rhizophora mucronata TaxID=61149 RepID=A0A2P2N350_RHIMU
MHWQGTTWKYLKVMKVPYKGNRQPLTLLKCMPKIYFRRSLHNTRLKKIT